MTGAGFSVFAAVLSAGGCTGTRRASEYRWKATPSTKQTIPTIAVLTYRFTGPPCGVFYLLGVMRYAQRRSPDRMCSDRSTLTPGPRAERKRSSSVAQKPWQTVAAAQMGQ